jgi:hypothetical protein
VRLALTIWWTCIALGTLFLSCSTYAQELNGVAHKFLQRHGVPCLFVLLPASIQAPKTRFYSPMAHSCYEIDVDALNGRPVAQALPNDLQS